ncbi:response regulator [Mucilaginibacter sp. HMF5004]|uniref:response regulator transcription factor n=1 Tax=Mucilaginibacter rivuli TaxID=2857527 RepID=UPI001C5E945D|nr:response regulator [Mucilaginibacter rivuli]MBW4888104.1 response regulator [Mucilaginibacter rivuli]
MDTNLKKILILDDNEDILEMVKEAMLSEGYDAESISATNDIIQSVKEYGPDLVLIDYLLPGINGGELCHHIKTNPETAHIPVVMLSAYPRVLASLGNYGSDAFIAKPFSLEELTGTVKGLLDKAEHAAV